MNKVKLSCYIEEYGDGIHGTPCYSENGEYFFINGNNLENGKININKDTLKIDEDEYKRIKRPLSNNTVLLSINGTLGRTAFYNGEKIALGKSACYINIKEGFSKEFFRYVLTTNEFQNYMYQAAGGSTIKNFAPSQVGEFEMLLPDCSQQEKIAHFLSYIDHKISLNNSICSDLEAMAKQLYDYWFVQFDFPDENGKPYKSSGGKIVWNEELKREIPEGWEVSTIEPYIDVIRGVSYEPEEAINCLQDGYVPLIKSNNLQDGKLLLDNIIYIPEKNVSKEQYLTNNSIFITMSSGSTEHVGKTASITFDTPYCYGAFCSKISILPKYRCFITQHFLSDYFKRKIRTVVVGTSIKNINNSHLTSEVLTIPPNKVLDQFEKMLTPNYCKQGELIQENQQLTSLRDFLLPMLMNGQVKVK